MGVVALVSKGWSTSATRFNIIVLLSTLVLYLYRDLWPLATYSERPADIEEGNILFVKIGILLAVAIFIPLFIPRRYIPVDPKVVLAASIFARCCTNIVPRIRCQTLILSKRDQSSPS